MIILLGAVGERNWNNLIKIPALVYYPIAYILVINYLATQLVIAENRTENNYNKYFIMFFVLPMGVWLIQPRINKVN